MLKYFTLKNGETLAYREQGSGSISVIMLHGNMTSSVHLDTFMDAISGNARVITPDLRGFGESTYNKTIDSLEELADDIIELIHHLNIDHYIIGGWSTGGGVAMIIAAKDVSRVAKLILVESVGIKGYPIFSKDNTGKPDLNKLLKTKEDVAKDPIQVIPIINAYANRDKDTLRAIWNALIYTDNKPEPKQYERYLEDMLTQRNLVDIDYALMTFNISNEHNGVVEGNNLISKIRAKTLIIQGKRDLVVPEAMGIGIRDVLGGHVQYETGDFGHSPFIDQPEWLFDIIRKFII
jgi:pimeloyl-ACP methyl ester carboxylesterase